MSKQRKTILMVGGGSGGHSRPLLAVANELKKQAKDYQLIYIGQKGDKYAAIAAENSDIDKVELIRAGKFRRYHSLGIRGYIKPSAIIKNFRDLFYIAIGFFQSRKIIRRYKPHAIFIKGGYVGVPVGYAARSSHIPIITHDSDAKPGLANRLIAKWVDTHTVAMPVENYDYPAADTVYVGVPVDPNLQKQKTTLSKAELNLPEKRPYILAMGGSLGAVRLNQAIYSNLKLINAHGLDVVHITGVKDYSKYQTEQTENYHVLEFTNQISDYLLNADYVISRAGASALAEISTARKPMIIVPNPYLTDGHQLANADIYKQAGAGLVVQESNLDADLPQALSKLFSLSEAKIKAMTDSQAALVVDGSAHKIAEVVKDAAKRREKSMSYGG